MKIALLPALLLAAGCATSSTPYAPVRDVHYQALGAEPFWMLTIGDRRIVLRTPDNPDRTWPRTLPRVENGVRAWESTANGETILIEARPGPCTSESERVYADQVRVRIAGGELRGCGGRLVGRD